MKGAYLVAGVLAALLGLAGSGQAQFPALQPPPDQEPIVGQPRFVNTASLALEGKRIVLFGVDPMMKSNPCFLDERATRAWDCGTAAMRTLMNMIGREEITCKPQAIDVFKRIYAKCDVHGDDIGKALVEAGLAMAVKEETDEYVALEAQAKSKKAGVWRGKFMTPSEYRTMVSNGEAIYR